MEITQEADYAIRAVLELALHSQEERIFSGEIARQQGIPGPFLTKILARLSAAGIVTAQRGVNGGIRLTRPAEQITLLQVVEAIDGPITLNRCARAPKGCVRSTTCVVHPIWLRICAELRDQLDGCHFAMLADQARTTMNDPAHQAACLLDTQSSGQIQAIG